MQRGFGGMNENSRVYVCLLAHAQARPIRGKQTVRRHVLGAISPRVFSFRDRNPLGPRYRINALLTFPGEAFFHLFVCLFIFMDF